MNKFFIICFISSFSVVELSINTCLSLLLILFNPSFEMWSRLAKVAGVGALVTGKL